MAKSDIAEAMEAYRDEATFWFGIHKEKPIKDIPVSYLKWVKTSVMWATMSKSLQKAVKYQINNRKQ